MGNAATGGLAAAVIAGIFGTLAALIAKPDLLYILGIGSPAETRSAQCINLNGHFKSNNPYDNNEIVTISQKKNGSCDFTATVDNHTPDGLTVTVNNVATGTLHEDYGKFHLSRTVQTSRCNSQLDGFITDANHDTYQSHLFRGGGTCGLPGDLFQNLTWKKTD